MSTGTEQAKATTRRGTRIYVENQHWKDHLMIDKKGAERTLMSIHDELINSANPDQPTYRLDCTPFLKLYAGGVKAYCRLTVTGQKVFQALCAVVQKAKEEEQIHLSFRDIDQVENTMSVTTFTRGMKELRDCGFIATSTIQSIYWLNGNFLWDGSRLKKPAKRAKH